MQQQPFFSFSTRMPTQLNIDKFRQQNPVDWKALLDELFPGGIPERARWEETAAIHEVLTHLCSRSGVHYTFLPSGGGLDLRGVQAGHAPYTSELLFSLPWLASIEALTFESFGDGPSYYPWAYFRIDLRELPSVGPLLDERGEFRQALTELSPGEFAPKTRWDERFDEGGELPASARPVVLARKGPLVLFSKVSIYNQLDEAAFGPQLGLSCDEFRERVGRVRHEAYTLPRDLVTKERLGAILLGKTPSLV